MAKGYRADRLGEEVRRIISDMLLTDIKDPRLQNKLISITGVDVSSDCSYATCYVSVLSPTFIGSSDENTSDSDSEGKSVIDGLSSAAGLFRTEIGRQVKIRHTPELIFKLDSSMEYGRHIENVIKSLDIKPEENLEEPDVEADS